MPQDLVPLGDLAAWARPRWAKTSDVGEELVDHRCGVGELVSAETGDVIAVEILQRDELVFHAGMTTVQRRPVLLRVGESQLSVAEAHTLVRMMTSAFGIVEGV